MWRQLPQRALIASVQTYRLLFRAWLGNACRFEPSCSTYALQALRRHGALRGTALTGARLLRCHPWCEGGSDPVPEDPGGRRAGLFSRLPGFSDSAAGSGQGSAGGRQR